MANMADSRALNRSKPNNSVAYLHFILDFEGRQEIYSTKVTSGVRNILNQKGFHYAASIARQAFINKLDGKKVRTSSIIDPSTGKNATL